MKRVGTREGRVENGDNRLLSDEGISVESNVNIVLPDLDPQRTYKVMSPRLARPEQAKDFVHQVVEEVPDTGPLKGDDSK